MNTRIAIISLIAALALGVAAPAALAAPASPAGGAQASANVARATVYKLRVYGLACPYCAYGIEKTIQTTGKVGKIQVQIAKGFVVVHMKPGKTFTHKRLKQLVSNAGFTLKGVKTEGGTGGASGE